MMEWTTSFKCSIIIPTRNRREQLCETLRHYRIVRGIEVAEILVVDDGSRDGTAEKIREMAADAPYSLRVMTQSSLGPAAARNAGLADATGPIVIFTGDDIEPSEGWLEGHLAAHERWPDEQAAVLGKTVGADADVSPFMRFLERDTSVQFGYADLDAGLNPDYRHFYTSNLSLKKSFLTSEPGPFDERFVHASWEDIDLGYRLARRGLFIHYVPDLTAMHRHTHTLATFLRRQEISGRTAFVFVQKHPERSMDMISPPTFLRRLVRRFPDIFALSAHVAGGVGLFQLAGRLYGAVLTATFARGFLAAEREVSRQSPDVKTTDRVAVVIVNWNGKSHLERCLPALLASLRKDWIVYVVDNGSTDGSIKFVRSAFPTVRLIELNRNVGFAPANNVALREILKTGDIRHVCLLNNDTRPEPDWIEELLKAVQASPRIGMASPKILRMDRPSHIDSTGHIFRWGQMIDRGGGKPDCGQYDGDRELIGACAAACLYRVEMIREIGLFDETFGSYYEDVDLSWRAHRAGWRAVYVPSSIVHHQRGGTTWRDPAIGREIMRRAWVNQVRCISRHATRIQKIQFLSRQTLGLAWHPIRTAFGGPPPEILLRLESWLLTAQSLLSSGRPIHPRAQPEQKQICYIVSKLGVGGAEKNLLLLAGHLPRARYAPVVLSLNGEGAYAGHLRNAGVPVFSLGFPHPRFLLRGIRFFSRCSFDLFHGFMFHGNLAARLLALLFGTPSISALRVAEGEKRWHLRIDRHTSAWVDRYTANSTALSEFAVKTIGVPADRLSVIPNALSTEDLRPPADPAGSRKRFKIPLDTRLIAMVGRLHIQKDPETFVRAAALIRKAEPETHFLIAGIGPLRNKLDRMIGTLGLTDCFFLPGVVPARDVYAACDIFVLPSRWEGFPNAAIEAMAAGRPVVLSDFPGAAEVVDYGVTGLIFPQSDAHELSRAVVGLLRNEDMRLQMGCRARETVMARHTVDRLVAENLKIYEQLTGSSQAK